MWGLYVDYHRSVVEHTCTMWEAYLFRDVQVLCIFFFWTCMSGIFWTCMSSNVMLMPVASHDEKWHVATQFDCLDLWNSVVTFTMPLASHDADTNVSGIT